MIAWCNTKPKDNEDFTEQFATGIATKQAIFLYIRGQEEIPGSICL